MINPMRRVTIATGKIEQSIQFYIDVLGAKVFYDHTTTTEPGAVSVLGPNHNVPHRLVSLQLGDTTVGMIGLMEYQDPKIKVPSLAKAPGMPYPLVLVIAVDDVDQVAARARSRGCHIICGPVRRESPNLGSYFNLVLVDPNGIVIDLDQPLAWDPRYPRPTSPVLRPTITVARDKMAPSIRFYQQVLGLPFRMDKEIAFAPNRFPLGEPGKVVIRLAVTQHGDSPFGNVALMTYLEPKMEVKPFTKHPGSPYPIIFVFRVDELDEILSRARWFGATIIARKYSHLPERGDAEVATVIDPNGVVIEMTKPLSMAG